MFLLHRRLPVTDSSPTKFTLGFHTMNMGGGQNGSDFAYTASRDIVHLGRHRTKSIVHGLRPVAEPRDIHVAKCLMS